MQKRVSRFLAHAVESGAVEIPRALGGPTGNHRAAAVPAQIGDFLRLRAVCERKLKFGQRFHGLLKRSPAEVWNAQHLYAGCQDQIAERALGPFVDERVPDPDCRPANIRKPVLQYFIAFHGYLVGLLFVPLIIPALSIALKKHIQKTANRDDIIELTRDDVAERGEWLRIKHLLEENYIRVSLRNRLFSG
jgi:hypothetical protein